MIHRPMMKSWAEAKEIYRPNDDSVATHGSYQRERATLIK